MLALACGSSVADPPVSLAVVVDDPPISSLRCEWPFYKYLFLQISIFTNIYFYKYLGPTPTDAIGPMPIGMDLKRGGRRRDRSVDAYLRIRPSPSAFAVGMLRKKDAGKFSM